jgi:uncharacterized protein YhaN
MRIDRIRVDAFGRLRDLDTGAAPLGGLVVVLGPNEAGKSTLFTFLTTALYGFQPATRDKNPHVPWGTDEASGSIHVHLDSGGCADVERTLRSQPSAKLTADGRTLDLRNQPVPWVDHVPRAVFRQVFAVTLAELAGLDGETWVRIQDKVIGSMGATDLQSARVVAESLEREAGEIWRPNRRGNQQLRHLQADLRALRGRRAAAQERDARVRRLVEERETVRTQLYDVRERRQLDRVEVERARSLLPVKRQLERIDALVTEAGDREALEGLPPDPSARWDELHAEIREREAALSDAEGDVSVLEATVARAGGARSILAHREDIAQLVGMVAGSAHDRARAVELEGEIREVEARLDASSARVVQGSWRDLPPTTLAELPVERIRERVGAAERPPAPEPAEGAPPPETWLALAVGVALLGWGLTTGPAALAAIGTVTLLAALGIWLWRARGGRREMRETTPRGPDLTTLLGGLPVRRERLEHPGPSLVSDLERLRDLGRTLAELRRALAASRARVEDVEEAARTLAEELGRDGAQPSEVVARALDRELREAEGLQHAAVTGERELGRARRVRDTTAAKLDTLRIELASLEARARGLSSGDVRLGLERARVRIDARDRAERLREELRREHPDLDELRARIEELDRAEHIWSVDEEALARASARIEEHDERIEDLLTRGEALDGEIARLRDEETVDAVDSEIASLKEEEARLVRLRDRKWVLAKLLREADRRFREEHQPDLMRRAGSYLDHLTGGRYQRLVADETEGEHLFHLVGPSLPAPVPLAPPVSTGTLEQAYLSLRLAIVDHLDQGGERLPLFVDEIFVNWDGSRRERGLDVLAGIARTRQVFVFTCHPDVAGELEERGGAVLRLDRSE